LQVPGSRRGVVVDVSVDVLVLVLVLVNVLVLVVVGSSPHLHISTGSGFSPRNEGDAPPIDGAMGQTHHTTEAT
jgi:hypothetical protein